jgi:presequence protease
MHIYLDASLNPLLQKDDFLQEGWRLDFQETALEYKGVVFNEMKGVY